MTGDAATLHCPNCGAPAAPGDHTCKYCQCTLATVSCPSCFALMFEGAAYCPSCGARRARTADGSRRARCAGCPGTMREVQIGATVVMECERCHGMWIDAKTFERICADHEAQAAALQLYPSPPVSQTAAEVRYRPCVACGKMMNRLNFGKVSGTVIDVCRHGVFLDAGELHRIASFLREGGLDRARQKQIEELKEQEERLRALRTRGDAHPDISYEMSVRTWTSSDLLKLLEQFKREA
jgi:Zn-finger nucleic acid-binding protein